MVPTRKQVRADPEGRDPERGCCQAEVIRPDGAVGKAATSRRGTCDNGPTAAKHEGVDQPLRSQQPGAVPCAMQHIPATSRVDNISPICPTCGARQILDEASDLITDEQKVAILRLVSQPGTRAAALPLDWSAWWPWLQLVTEIWRVPDDAYGVYEVRRAGALDDVPLVHIGKAYTAPLQKRVAHLLRGNKGHSTGYRILHGETLPNGQILPALPAAELEVRWAICDDPTDEEGRLQDEHKAMFNNRLPTHDRKHG